MFDFFNKLFKPAPPSGATAKERLRLVLLSDHLSLAPEVIEALKRDLLVVISRYVEIDQAHADVTFEHREGEVAMLASIPITGVRERTRSDDPPQRPSAPAASAAMERPLRDEPAAEATSMKASAVEPVEAVRTQPTIALESTASESAATEATARESTATEGTALESTPFEATAVEAMTAIQSAQSTAAQAEVPESSSTPAAPASGAPRRRRRRKSAAAKRAGVQTVQLNKPAQA